MALPFTTTGCQQTGFPEGRRADPSLVCAYRSGSYHTCGFWGLPTTTCSGPPFPARGLPVTGVATSLPSAWRLSGSHRVSRKGRRSLWTGTPLELCCPLYQCGEPCRTWGPGLEGLWGPSQVLTLGSMGIPTGSAKEPPSGGLWGSPGRRPHLRKLG